MTTLEFPEKTNEWQENELRQIVEHFKTKDLSELDLLTRRLQANGNNRSEQQIKTLLFTVSFMYILTRQEPTVLDIQTRRTGYQGTNLHSKRPTDLAQFQKFYLNPS